MSHLLLAKKYARSLFVAAQDGRAIETVDRVFASFCETLDGQADLSTALRHPLVPGTKRTVLLKEVLGGDAPDLFRNFVELVLTKRNFLSFREIYQQYREMALESQGRIIVDVSSPFPLTDDQRQTLTEALRQKLGKTAVLEERVDRTLVGGMVVRAGDEVWDGSLRERLRRLENALKA